ncbi:DNA polymerase III subunit gamma and tau [Micromonospora siamensis]|uniref:DNA polymerase III subunit gamma/tau n=1 Tax=Micromonospora siamensis TaxID=299152 RepID=A0A1C5GR79_9ACTN|nr:DNA polymerase III subunit gamma and tau [Micromonospora siamensis]SCG36296.1 DNA polymerase-3 subunit gamma/tau [Micromonospora siamensis]
MTLALYRKYRPRTFAEMIGQEQVTEPLSQALRSGRLNHAYLFSGPRGCGKTSSARILARSLNCEQGPTPEPCGQCESCRGLAPDGNGSIDVIEIDAASHGGVDDARDLREKAFFAPARSRFKIYIIDEAHMVSSAGFNALLKLVEEPPEYVKFIFATTEPEKVLGTIRSRTHHYPFRLFPPKVVRPYLEQLTEAEGVRVDPAVFPLVVRAGAGSMRDSLSVLDQLIAGAGPEGVSYARAVALLGVTDSALIDEMCDALAAGDGAAAYATVDRVAEAGHDLRRFASDLLERLRDLIVLQQVPDAAAKGLIDGPADQMERMAAQAQQLGPATLSRCADIVHNGLVEMRGATAPRLLMELICARMLLPGADDSTGGLLQRLERMERRLTLGGGELPSAAAGPAPVAPAPEVRQQPPAPTAAAAAPPPQTAGEPAAAAPPQAVPPAAQSHGSDPQSHGSAAPDAGAPARRPVPPSAVLPDPATPAPPRPGASAPGALDAVAVRRAWPDIVAKVNRIKKPAAALMRDAVVRDVDGDTLVLTVKSPVLAQMMGNQTSVLAEALYEEFGVRWQIRCEVAGERGGSALGAPARSSAPARPADRPPAAPAQPASPGRADSGRDGAGGQGGPAGAASGGSSGGGSGYAGGPNGAASGFTGGASGATSGSAGGPNGAASGPVGGPGGGAYGAVGSSGGPASGPARSGGPEGGARNGGRAPGAGPAGATASGSDDEDWPEPARPGGNGERPGSARSAGADDSGGDWPEAARPGGVPASAPTASTSTASTSTASTSTVGTPTAGASAAATPAVSGPGVNTGSGSAPAAPRRAGNGAPVSSAIAAARAAAAAAASGAGKGTRTGPEARKTADADWAGEPPYDPDFDGPLRGGRAGGQPATPAYEGFDPGDEPLDVVIDERTARQSSEEQAVQLLREAFGAEKIDEVDAR